MFIEIINITTKRQHKIIKPNPAKYLTIDIKNEQLKQKVTWTLIKFIEIKIEFIERQ